MAANYDHDAFMNCMEVRHVQAGMVLVSVADMFKAQWVVLAVATRVADRHVELTMQCGGRVLTKATHPLETVLRRVSRSAL